MSIFNKMKKYLSTDFDCDFCCDSPFVDYINELYSDALAILSKDYNDLFVEASTQCGRGGVFAQYTVNGTTFEAHWDFQCECEAILEFAENAHTEEELIQSIASYIEGYLEESEELCDEDDD